MSTIPRRVFREDHEIFRRSVRRFIDANVVPHHAAWEAVGCVPPEAWLAAGKAGLLLCAVDEARGGGGGDFLHSAVVIEELARVGASGPCFSLHSDVVAPYLTRFGTEAQKSRWLALMAKGSALGAVAMTEPDGGSDLKAIRTTAVREGDKFVITGQKVYISNAQGAAFVIVACKTDDKGLSLILVEADRPGFSLGRRLEKIGCKAQDLSELFFEDCRVPATNLIGEEGRGFQHLTLMLPQERLVQAVRAVAACEAMLSWTLDYTHERKAFGRRLIDMETIAFKLAELHTDVLAQRVFVDRCLELHLAGEMDGPLAAAVKLTTTEAQGRVADACVQVFGAAGYMWETPIARAYADARQARIAGGTVEIMKLIVSRSLMR